MALSSIETLRRLAKEKLDQQSAILVPLRRALDDLVLRRQEVERSTVTEGDVVIVEDEVLKLFTYLEYLKTARAEMESLDRRIAKLQEEVRQQEEAVREAYADVRRYEILLENKRDAMKKEEVRREQAEIEETVQTRIAARQLLTSETPCSPDMQQADRY